MYEEIRNISVNTVDDDQLELGAKFCDTELFFRIPKSRFCEKAIGDALFLAVLAPAMLRGCSVKIPSEFPVSSTLYNNAEIIQRVWRKWNFKLKTIEINTDIYNNKLNTFGSGLFYAGGIDSSYSLIDHLSEVDSLICAYGFDFSFTQEEIRESVKRLNEIANHFKKELIPVETNHSIFLRQLGISRTFVFGLTLSCIALLCGLERCFIASSQSLSSDIRPDGSHPNLDYLFGNASTQIIHDDVSVTRFEKTLAVTQSPALLENLRVCWYSHDENCGSCSKCLRTMTALRLIGVEGPFPPISNLKDLRKMASSTEVLYITELIVAAHERGDDAVIRELKKGLRIQDIKKALRLLDQGIFHGKMRSRYIRKFDSDWDLVKWNLRPDLEIS